jgi:hypothetical protein
MDELKLNLGSKFLRKLAAKLIVKYIKKHFGCNSELELNKLKISYEEGDVVIKTDLELKIKKQDTDKILEKLEDLL